MGGHSLCQKIHVNTISCGFKEGKVEIHIFGIHLRYRGISSFSCSALELYWATEKMSHIEHDNYEMIQEVNHGVQVFLVCVTFFFISILLDN